MEGGSQSTPGEYIDWLLDVVEACDRVLAPHGSLCVELGDTYSGSGGAGGDYDPEKWRQGQPAFPGSSKMARVRKGEDTKHPYQINPNNTIPTSGTGWPLAKSLSLIPETFRFAMVYGTNPHTGRTTEPWRLRNVIRWVRPNPPVGALGDKFRPATSELMVFCKSAKRYFDLDAVRGEVSEWTMGYSERHVPGSARWNDSLPGSNRMTREVPMTQQGAPPLDWWNIPLLEGEEETRYGPGEKPKKVNKDKVMYTSPDRNDGNGAKRYSGEHPNGAPPLDWWEIPPGGYEGAHYAVFPPELCVKPVKAMCPEKVCRQCGEPSRRIVDYETVGDYANRPGWRDHRVAKAGGNQSLAGPGGNTRTEVTTQGWSDCGHDDWRPGMVLDCFGGSGTTALVATGHGRDCILIDLDSRNFDLALDRVGPFILTRGDLDTPTTKEGH